MTLQRMTLRNFTIFERTDIHFERGVNVLLGANGTGKTHLMKLMYSICSVMGNNGNFEQELFDKLVGVFCPSNRQLSHLVRRGVGADKQPRRSCSAILCRDSGDKDHHSSTCAAIKFSNMRNTRIKANLDEKWGKSISCVYIPTKEMLANAPGFLALYEKRLISFEEVYRDIILNASLDPVRGKPSAIRQKLEKTIGKIINGKVEMEETGEFFLKDKNGRLEFTLVSEGMRKLALLLLLINKEVLSPGSILFWDEPEANLNPSMMKTVAQIILELQRIGIQVFLATHDFALLSFLDLLREEKDDLCFHSFCRNSGSGQIENSKSTDFASSDPNMINDTFIDIAEMDINRALKRTRK